MIADQSNPIFSPRRFRRRVLLFFGSICGLSLLAVFLEILLGPAGDRSSQAWLLPAPLLLIAGMLLVLLSHATLASLRAIDLIVTGLTLLALSPIFRQSDFAARMPFVFGIILLGHATLVPSGLWPQLLLSLVAIAAFLAGNFWLAGPVSASVFWKNFLWGAFELGVLLGLGIAIAEMIRHTWRHLFEAESLGNYQIQSELGGGGMGKVYAASHAFLCRPTAIKVLNPAVGSDTDQAIARFENEIKLSATLNHPNTIKIFDYGRGDDGTFFYAMELLDGMDLQKLVEHSGPMPEARTIYVLEQICGALAEAHRRGIVHRDIKPSNIFLARQGGLYDFVKVLDFGLAKEIGGSEKNEITQTGELLGTPRYIAPESVQAKDKIDARTDIYLVGAVAYWMLAGRAPFDAKSPVEIIVEHLTQPVPPPSQVSELKISPEIEAIVLKCMEKLQDDRYQSVAELIAALAKVSPAKPWDQAQATEWWQLHFPEIAQTGESPVCPPQSALRTLARRRA